MDPTLIAYCLLTLAVLWAIAERVDPTADLTRAGCRIGYVYDGDTIELDCGGQSQTARLVGFDTPETREAGCAVERALGQAATERLLALVLSGDLQLTRTGHDRYGRELVRLEVEGADVATTLISEGLAVPYHGGTRIDWCARLGQ